MTAAKLSIDCDLSRTALEEVARQFMCPLHELTVYAPYCWQMRAHKLQGDIGFALVLVPDALLATKQTWGAQRGNDLLWTGGGG
jgi:hypothetical protein